MEHRLLRGHGSTATCCIASRLRPGLVATAGEDGYVCWFDLRCKGNEDVIYVSSGNEVKCFDVHMAASCKELESYAYNTDEINQIVFHSKSSFLAAADDAGDVKILDTHQRCPYKTLRSGHTSICSSVQFIPWNPWEVISGGLDSKLVMWDFSRGRPTRIIDFGSTGDAAQCLNPAFIHNLIVPEADMVDKVGKICVVARGDGIISILNVDSKYDEAKSKPSVKRKQTKPKSKGGASSSDSQTKEQSDREVHIDFSMGGHSSAVSSVTFSMFGERGRFIISGGNDRFIKVWDWSKFKNSDSASTGDTLLCSNMNLGKKVNWLCTTPSDSENLVVCDTSKLVKVYSVG